jgi:hypothetical protein
MPRKEFESFTRLDASDVNTYLMDQSVMTFGGTAARGSAIPTPVEGMVTYLEDSNSLQLYDGSSWTAAGGVSSGNAVINGGFDIWQRGTSFASASLFQYTADRWFGNSFAGVTATVSQQTFTPGTAPVAGYESQFFLRFNRGAGTVTNPSFLTQRIEDVRTFAGQTITLSFFAKAATAGTISVSLDQNFGSGGSSTVSVTGQTASLTTSWSRFTLTFVVASVSGKTIGSSSYLDLVFNIPVLFGNNSFDIWGVQLEAGPVATPFRRNANSLQGELAACQRYYWRTSTLSSAEVAVATGISASSTVARIFVQHPVTMRVAPTSIDFSGLAIGDRVNYLLAVSSIAQTEASASSSELSVTNAAGATTTRMALLVKNVNANNFIGFSAEL